MGESQSYTEKMLLQRVAEGEEKAFRELVHQYHALCYTTAFRILNDSWMAEDIVQEVFLKVWLKRRTLTDITNFGGWLRTLTARRLYDYLKQKKSEAARIDNWWQETKMAARESMAIAAEESEFQSLVQQAVLLLTPRQQQAFRLIKQEGYSREEAARILGISPDTVKTHLDQAMRSIRAFCAGKLDRTTLSVLTFLATEKYF